jgi:hypothetical protein
LHNNLLCSAAIVDTFVLADTEIFADLFLFIFLHQNNTPTNMIMKVFPLAYLFIALALVLSKCDAQTPIQQNFHLFSDSSCTDLIGVGSYYSDSVSL